MSVRLVLFGATGMIGGGALRACLADDRVAAVRVIGRTPCGVTHPRLTEVLHADFLATDPLREALTGFDACLYCLGVSSLGLDEAAYTRITHDYTLAAARTFLAASPEATFCYVSGASTDSTEQGRVMWARVKGRTENALLRLGFRRAFMFRPGFIQPVEGARSKTAWYQAIYTLMGPISALLRRAFPGVATSTAILGRAMIEVAVNGYSTPILESRDINAVGTRRATS